MLKQAANDALSASKIARSALTKIPGVVVGSFADPPHGLYLANYSQCLLNRQIDIFDDTLLLLENDRIPSACVVSRAMIETHAFAKHLGNSVADTLDKISGQDSVETCMKTILRFTNSSRFKQTEQKRVAKGTLNVDDYKFTEQARDRMLRALAESEHVMDALRSLFKEEIEHTGKGESQFEFVYDALSEWVHPSQTSVFHNYVPRTHMVPSSVGEAHLYDVAKLQCTRALHFITDSEAIHAWLVGLAEEITRRSVGASPAS